MMEMLGSHGDMGGRLFGYDGLGREACERQSEVGWEEVERNMGEWRG